MRQKQIRRYSIKQLQNISSQMNLIPNIFWTHSFRDHELSKHRLKKTLEGKIVRLWIAARPIPQDKEMTGRNEWSILIEDNAAETLSLELRQSDPMGNTIVLIRRCDDLGHESAENGWFALIKGFAFSRSTLAFQNMKVGDFIDRVEASGATRYRLRHVGAEYRGI
jgi:hypothetical protein